ncbi:MAG: hypothetical protein V4563_10765 [Pseudomonadota bacterium]
MHLSTDLVIAGQLGIRAHYQALMEKTRKHYVAKHEIMDFLARNYLAGTETLHRV